MHKIEHKDASDLLRVSQFLSLHAPESPQTRHFLNSKAISLLPPGAIVVNTARGGLVVDDDLIAALKSGRVAAAGLDVFEGEPKLNPEYVSLKNTFLLPHIGSATIEPGQQWACWPWTMWTRSTLVPSWSQLDV